MVALVDASLNALINGSRDEDEHSKKYHVPRRRRLGFPPITPNACVRDTVLHQIFDSTWYHIVSCLSAPAQPTSLLKVNGAISLCTALPKVVSTLEVFMSP